MSPPGNLRHSRSSSHFFVPVFTSPPVLLNINRKKRPKIIKLSDSINWHGIKIELQNAASKLIWFSELLGNYFLYLSIAFIYSFTLFLVT